MQATIKQVAQRAGVSIATVSYVLNGAGVVTDETRQRVLAAVAELNYQPRYAARSMRGRSYTLGVTLPSHPGRLAEPALAEVLSGLADAAALRGYFLLLATADASQDETELCLSLAHTRRVDGLVLLDVLVDDPRAQRSRLPAFHMCAPVLPLPAPIALRLSLMCAQLRLTPFSIFSVWVIAGSVSSSRPPNWPSANPWSKATGRR